jgi:hypothetical protein
VVVIAVVVVVGVASNGGGGAPRQPAPAAAIAQLESVSEATMTAAAPHGQLNFARTASGGSLVSGGKPEVLYIGAEFCPICAAERWPMTMALMKFGTFTNLQQTHSATADGDVGTWSYYGATYTSPYLVFDAKELYTNQPQANYYKPLQKISSAEQTVWSANEGSSLSFPFVDLGGQEVLETSQYNPSLVYYQSFSTVLAAVGNNASTIGSSIDAAAAVFTKYLCGLTDNQPGAVCSAVANVAAPVVSSNTGQTTPSGG